MENSRNSVRLFNFGKYNHGCDCMKVKRRLPKAERLTSLRYSKRDVLCRLSSSGYASGHAMNVIGEGWSKERCLNWGGCSADCRKIQPVQQVCWKDCAKAETPQLAKKLIEKDWCWNRGKTTKRCSRFDEHEKWGNWLEKMLRLLMSVATGDNLE